MPDKFLKLVEENTPDKELDSKIVAKRALQRCLMDKDIKCEAHQSSEDVMIHLPDGRVVKVEVKELVEVEDQEMVVDDKKVEQAQKALKAAEAITGTKEARAGMLGRDPKKNVERAVGKLYNKVAKQLNQFTKEF